MPIRATHYLLLLAMLVLPRPAMGACLLTDYSVHAEYDRSAAVVTGQVISEHPVAASGGYYEGVVYTVSVEGVYRGDIRGRVNVFSENSSGRFPMQPRGRYILFIYRETGRLMVDNCGNSGPVSEKTDILRAVNSIAQPRRPNRPQKEAQLAVQNHVTIGGRDFSFNRDDGIEARYPFRASYSANMYTVILPFTTSRFRYADGRLTSSGGLTFVQAGATDAEVVHVSGGSGSGDNRVTLRTTAHGGLAAYTHETRGHTFVIRFDPPLLEPANAKPPPVTYRMSLDHFADLVTGQISPGRDGAQIVLEWRHARPAWAQTSPFRSALWMQEDSYQLQVSPLP